MTEREIQDRLIAGGFTLSISPDGRLLVGPPSKLTDELRDAIREHRDALIEETKAMEELKHMEEWDAIKNYL